jgi:deoxyadenosine/deoxycytidine kinase
MPVWSIEGIPGVGKSTVLAQIKDIKAINGSPVIVLDEPIDEWNTVVDDNNLTLFELFYKDPKQHGFAFQMLALITRVNLLKKAIEEHPDSHIFTERCPSSDRVFAQLLFENGSITKEQYAVYNKAWKLLNKVPITGIVYMRASAECALQRCISRGRDGEVLSLDYLQQCLDLHETWLLTVHNWLVIDAEMNTATTVKSILRFVKTKEMPFSLSWLLFFWFLSLAIMAGLLFLF